MGFLSAGSFGKDGDIAELPALLGGGAGNSSMPQQKFLVKRDVEVSTLFNGSRERLLALKADDDVPILLQFGDEERSRGLRRDERKRRRVNFDAGIVGGGAAPEEVSPRPDPMRGRGNGVRRRTYCHIPFSSPTILYRKLVYVEADSVTLRSKPPPPWRPPPAPMSELPTLLLPLAPCAGEGTGPHLREAPPAPSHPTAGAWRF